MIVSSDDSTTSTLPTTGSESDYSDKDPTDLSVGKEQEPMEISVSEVSNMDFDTSNNHVDGPDDNHKCLSSKRRAVEVSDEDRSLPLPRHSSSVAAKICKEINHESLIQKKLYIDANENRNDSNAKGNQNGTRMNSGSSLGHYQVGSSRSAYYNSLEKRAKHRSKVFLRKEDRNLAGKQRKDINSNHEKKVATPRRKLKTRVQMPSKVSKKSTEPKAKTVTVFSRLYMQSQCMQEEGKRRRQGIEKMRREREKRKQEQYQQAPAKKISAAQASELYYRGMEKKISLERRIAEYTRKHSTVPYKSILLANNSRKTRTTVF